MKVAVMGAGLSGLSCSIILERNGIKPVIFEKRSMPGDRFVNGEALLSMLNRPVDDSLSYLARNYDISLKPVANISRIVLLSENEQAVIRGHLGFVNIRGRSEDSFENQLFKQVGSEIHFNSNHTYEELLKEFSHVVLATGDGAYTAKVQEYQEDLTVSLKGAIVKGSFDRYTVIIWLDNRVAPKGYAYLLPLSENEANIVTTWPDYPENRPKASSCWDIFYEKACGYTGQPLEITDSFEVTRYIIGTSKYPKIGNTYFTGNCFGSVMPFMGFGQFVATMTGIYAANDILKKGVYEDLVKPFQKEYKNSLVLRRAMETLDNKRFDLLVRTIGTNWGSRIFSSRAINFVKLFSYVLRPVIHSRREV